jgi:Bacterial Ig-like domain/Bacterial Ig domain
MTNATDTGNSATDDLTKNTTPSFQGSCTNGETIKLYIDTVYANVSAVCTGGSYTLTPSTALTNGIHAIGVTTTDLGNNESLTSIDLSITIDTSSPTAPSTAPDMQDSSDTGDLNTDNITNDTTPSFQGSCTNGETVNLYVDTTLAGSVTCTGSGYLLTPSPALTNGIYNAKISFTDTAWNESGQSTSLSFEINTTLPWAPANAPDMTSASDTGKLNTDDITVDTTPEFTGTCTDGYTVKLYVDSVLNTSAVCSWGTYSITANTLTEWSFSASVTQTDTIGNESWQSLILPFTVDSTVPATMWSTDLVITSDSGTSSSDDITFKKFPEFSGTCTTGEIITLYVDATSAATAECTGGVYSLIPTSALLDGNHDIQVTTTDPAGNESAKSAVLTITVDTLAPTTPSTSPNMTDPSDTGASNSDNITSNLHPDFSGTCTDGETVRLYIDSVEVSSVVCASSTFTLWVPTALTSGTHTAVTTFADVSWNESGLSSSLSFEIDTTAPSAPNDAPNMTDASDTGTSNSDNITSNTLPAFSGVCTDGEIVNLYIDGSLATSTLCAGGTFTLFAPVALTDGAHDITTTTTDVSGNESGQGPIITITVDASAPTSPNITTPTNGLPVTGMAEPGSIVTLTTPSGSTCTATADINGNYSCSLSPAPTNGENITATAKDSSWNISTPTTISGGINISIPWVPDLVDTSDTGASNTDNITTDTMPTITGSCLAEHTVNLYIDNILSISTACIAGNFTLTVPTGLSDGSHVLSTTFSNSSGSASTHSPNLTLYIDTSLPARPTIATPTSGLPVNGTAEPGSSVTVTTPSGATCTVIADINGNYSCSLSPTPINYCYYYRSFRKCINTSYC